MEKTYFIDDFYHVSLVLYDFLSLKNFFIINILYACYCWFFVLKG